jgi:arylsulfatase A-like enzyme
MIPRAVRRAVGRWRTCVALAALCAALAPGGTPDARAARRAGAASPGRQPNIVFILADDLSSNLVQYMPNLQAMQREGTSFSNYFVTDSLCCPSRSSIFTGKFPHNTGVFTNSEPDGGYAVFNAHGNEALTFAVALQRGGYQTALLGKYLNGYLPGGRRAAGLRHRPRAAPAMPGGDGNAVPAGWNEWDVAGNGYRELDYVLNQNGRIVRHGNQPQDYLTDVVAEKAEAFVRRSAPGPFFVEIATFAPHSPYIPAPRDADRFPGLAAPRPAAFGARPGADAPRWLRSIPPLSPADVQRIDRAFRMRAQSVLAIDRMLGRLRSTLAALGDQDTYVVFSSDNGLHMGEYSLRPGKQTPFDIDVRVPLVVVGPGVAKGQVVSAIVENVDLCPTFTELAGASAPTSPDGRSLVPLLRGSPATEWRRSALVEHHRPFPNPSDPDAPMLHAANPTSYAALRTETALYVEYESGEIGYYDLARDPDELANVASNLPAAKRQRLHDALRASKQCRGAEACWNAQRMAP